MYAAQFAPQARLRAGVMGYSTQSANCELAHPQVHDGFSDSVKMGGEDI